MPSRQMKIFIYNVTNKNKQLYSSVNLNYKVENFYAL